MFWTIVKKEILDHLLSIRFAILLLLCLLLLPFSLYINYEVYTQRIQRDYRELTDAYSKEQERPYSIFLDADSDRFKGLIPPSPLRIFAVGLEDALPRYFVVNRNGVKSGPSPIAQAALTRLFGELDFLFAVKIVFSLLAVLFAFDLIVREKEMGTLKLVLSNAVPRDMLIVGKYIGGFVVLITPLICGFLLGLLVVTWAGFPLFSADTLARIGLLLGSAILYISIFFCLGMLVSSWVESSRTSMVVLLLLWVAIVLIISKAGYLAAEVIMPVESDQAVYLGKVLTREAIEREKGEKLKVGQGGVYGSIGNNLSYETFRAPIAKEYEQKLRESLEKLDQSHEMKKRRQESLGISLSRISPVASFTYIVTDLTQTGQSGRDAVLSAIRQYYLNLDEHLFSKFWIDFVGNNVQGGVYGDWHQVPSPTNYPRLKVGFPTLPETVGHLLLDLMLLILFNAVFFISAYVKFLRYEA